MRSTEIPEFWQRVESLHPEAWIRQEVWRLSKLLELHVELGLETGTDPRRIVALLPLPREAA